MKYKVGDKVRVRKWEDMEKEFGLNQRGNIDCDATFVTGMKKYCGKIVKIREIFGDVYFIEGNYWYWSGDMFEDIEPIKITRKVKTYAWDSSAIKEQIKLEHEQIEVERLKDFIDPNTFSSIEVNMLKKYNVVWEN